jgi:RND family efflux transporter MFP subunit
MIKNISIIPTLLFAFFLMTGCSEKPKQTIQKQVPALKVESITVKKEKYPIWLEYTGMTKASSDQEVRARVSGRLEKIFFKDGAYVKKGDKLFQIEQSQYKSNLQSAKAKKEQNIASLKLAKADVERYKPLVRDGLAPRATLEQNEAKLGEIIASISADEAAISNAELELSYTIILSPVSGHVSARRVDVGNLVGYGESTLLTTLVQTDNIYTYFSPSEADVQRIYKFRSSKELPAFIEVRGQGEDVLKRKRLNGFVDFSNNSVDPLTSTISMRATIDNKEHSVYPGTFVYVNLFLTDKFEFIMVPPQAIFEDQMGKFVFTIDANNKASRTSVKTTLSSRYYTAVSGDIKDGDSVIISGLMKVKSGSLIDAKDMSKTKGIMQVMYDNKLIPKFSKVMEK